MYLKGNTSDRQLSKERDVIECFCLGFLLTLEFLVLDMPQGYYPKNETFFVKTGFILKAGDSPDGRTGVSKPLLTAFPERASLPEPSLATQESAFASLPVSKNMLARDLELCVGSLVPDSFHLWQPKRTPGPYSSAYHLCEGKHSRSMWAWDTSNFQISAVHHIGQQRTFLQGGMKQDACSFSGWDSYLA